MRAVPILATLALGDVLLVAAGAIDPAHLDALGDGRAQLVGTIAVAGAGIVALAALSLAMRCTVHRFAAVRLATALAIGVGYAVAAVVFAAGTYLWLTPAHYPVAVVCGATVLLLAWQAIEVQAGT